jgi:hypothetical protein
MGDTMSPGVFESALPGTGFHRAGELSRHGHHSFGVSVATFAALCLTLLLDFGCGQQAGTRFYLPLEVDGRPAGAALVDTGSEPPIILGSDFGLRSVDVAERCLVTGCDQVVVSEPFLFSIAGIPMGTKGAIIDPEAGSLIGTSFFRLTQTVLKVDFVSGEAKVVRALPPGDSSIFFFPPDNHLRRPDAVWLEVEAKTDSESKRIWAIVDTGAPRTVVQDLALGDVLREISHPDLGTVRLDVEPLGHGRDEFPAIIIGTDVMAAWGDVWYLGFGDGGGLISIYHDRSSAPAGDVLPAIQVVPDQDDGIGFGSL